MPTHDLFPLAVDEGALEAQTRSAGGSGFRAPWTVGDLDAPGALCRREDADEPFGDLVALRVGPNPILLADAADQADGLPGVRASRDGDAGRHRRPLLERPAIPLAAAQGRVGDTERQP